MAAVSTPAPAVAAAAIAAARRLSGSTGDMAHHRHRLSAPQRQTVNDRSRSGRSIAQANGGRDQTQESRRPVKSKMAAVGPSLYARNIAQDGGFRVGDLRVRGGEGKRERLGLAGDHFPNQRRKLLRSRELEHGAGVRGQSALVDLQRTGFLAKKEGARALSRLEPTVRIGCSLGREHAECAIAVVERRRALVRGHEQHLVRAPGLQERKTGAQRCLARQLSSAHGQRGPAKPQSDGELPGGRVVYGLVESGRASKFRTTAGDALEKVHRRGEPAKAGGVDDREGSPVAVRGERLAGGSQRHALEPWQAALLGVGLRDCRNPERGGGWPGEGAAQRDRVLCSGRYHSQSQNGCFHWDDLVSTRTALFPPNPNELDSTTAGDAGTPPAGTWRMRS